MRGFAVSSFLGICSSALFTNLPDKSWCLLIIAIAFVILVVRLLGLLPLRCKCFLYTIYFFLGFSYVCWTANSVLQAQLPQAWEGQDLQVVGLVKDIPEKTPTAYSFLLAVDKVLAVNGQPIRGSNFKGLIRLNWYPQKQEVLPNLQAGERWQLGVRAKRPNGLANLGGFDYERWLFSQRILATGYVRSQEESLRLAASSSFSVAAARERISQAIEQALGEQSSTGLIQGLAVADTSGMSKDQWKVLQATGTAHLLSISGLHIAMVASFGFLPIMLIWWLFPNLYLWLPARLAGGMLGAVFATVYALLAGFNIPTQRSLIMVLILLAGLLLKQRFPFSTALAMALVLVLVLDPLAPLSIGFWLSFGSVALLAGLSLHQTRSVWVKVFTVQLGLSVFLIPINIAFFSSLPVYSPLANLIAIPWVTLLVVPLILLGILCLPISADLAGVMWHWASQALDLLSWGLEYVAQLPNALMHFPALPWYWLSVALLGLLLILLPRGLPGRWLGLLCLIPLFTWQAAKPALGEFRLSVLDVGQGLATAIQTAKHVLVFDTGAKSPYGFDMGEVVVTPWLRSQGVAAINTLMISHNDNDHRGGADYLLAHFPIQELATNQANNFEHLATSTQLTVCVAGQTWLWDEVKFEVLNPLPNLQYEKKNNQACVLRISNAAYSVLLTADIEQAAEQALLTKGANLRADVVLVPHHGSKTSSSRPFLKAVTPKLAIVSSGYLNRFHHPHPKVLERYQSQGIKVLNTADAGAMQLDFSQEENQSPIIFTYRKKYAKFWNKRNNY